MVGQSVSFGSGSDFKQEALSLANEAGDGCDKPGLATFSQSLRQRNVRTVGSLQHCFDRTSHWLDACMSPTPAQIQNTSLRNPGDDYAGRQHIP
jgi:hypothetical protein